MSKDSGSWNSATASALFIEKAGKSGGEHHTRLLPTKTLLKRLPREPQQFTLPKPSRPVRMARRKTKDQPKQEIPFDKSDPRAVDTADKLALINGVNARYNVTYQPLDKNDQPDGERRRLMTNHFAQFTDDFQTHGRLYCEGHSHLSIRGVERRTICFQRDPATEHEPCIEFDFSGMHPRLAYHLTGIDYKGDLYALWGEDTTPAMRLLAKKVINTALNANGGRRGALSSCRLATLDYIPWENNRRKSAQGLEEAAELREALDETGLTFGEIYDVVLERHAAIADWFGSDAGIRFMHVDGRIALEVLYHFAEINIPALGVHDSYVIPESCRDAIPLVMPYVYKAFARGFYPEIKEVKSA